MNNTLMQMKSRINENPTAIKFSESSSLLLLLPVSYCTQSLLFFFLLILSLLVILFISVFLLSLCLILLSTFLVHQPHLPSTFLVHQPHFPSTFLVHQPHLPSHSSYFFIVSQFFLFSLPLRHVQIPYNLFRTKTTRKEIFW